MNSADDGIDFSQVNLKGRDEEVKIMREVFRDASNASCFVRGASGTGKSTLIVESLYEEVLKSDGFFVSGKHDQVGSPEPYSALVDAFSELSDFIDASKHKRAMVHEMLESLGDDTPYFVGVVPGFQKLLRLRAKSVSPQDDGDPAEEKPIYEPDIPTEGRSIKLSWAFERLKLNLCSTLEIVTKFHPVVLVLDDLQWSEPDVLALVGSLQESQLMKKFMFVGSYRDNEFKENDPIEKALEGLSSHTNTTSISVENLSVTAINQLVATLLQHRDPDTTMPLAQVVHRKTDGNVFFALQLLQMLQRLNLIFFSFQTMKWDWHVDKIVSETSLSGNAADVVASKMHCLDEQVQKRLQVAACLGDKFDAQLVDEIMCLWNTSKTTQESWCDLGFNIESLSAPEESYWDIAVKHNLIDRTETSPGQTGDRLARARYTFSHDRMRSAAYNLMSSRTCTKSLHLRIGRFILRKYSNRELSEDWMLLLATNQLNQCISLIEDAHASFQLAALNLEAACRVASKSAFFTAAEYLTVGLNLLGPCKWSENYDLTLRMVTKSAEYEYCCGHFELSATRVAEVLTHARSHDDKIEAHFILIESLGVQKKGAEAFAAGRKLLAELNYPFPRRPGIGHILVEYGQVKRLLKGRSDDDLVRMPEMTDQESANALKVMTVMTTFAWFGDEMDMFALLIIRMLKTTLKHGVTTYSAAAYAYFGIVFAKFFALSDARRMGKLALRMLERFNDDNDKEVESRVVCMTASFTTHLSSPLHDVLNPLLHSHKMGLKTGDLSYGTIAAASYCVAYYISGLPLKNLDKDAKYFASEMENYNQLTALSPCLLFRQAALNLMGKTKDPLRLQGGAIKNIDAFLAQGTEIENGRTNQSYTSLMMQLAFYMGDLAQAGKMADRNLKFKDADFPFFIASTYPFWRGLIYLSLVQTGEKTYLRKAVKQIRLIRKYVKGGMVNCHYMLMLLEAEYETTMTLKKGLPTNPIFRDEMGKKLRRKYDSAIQAAVRSGFIQAGALANERAGIISIQFDEWWAKFYLRNACTSYLEWGAEIKAAQLRRDYSKFDIAHSTRSQQSSNLKGRERYDHTDIQQHHASDVFKLSDDKNTSENFKLSDDNNTSEKLW